MTVCSVAGSSGKFGSIMAVLSQPAADLAEHGVFGKCCVLVSQL